MVQKKVLFVLSSSLGWRTYQHQITSVVGRRDDIDAEFYICRPTVAERALMYNLPCVPIRRLVDPMFVWGWRLGAWWQRTGKAKGYDAVHVATQDNALAFAELSAAPSLSLAIDITRRAYTQIHSSKKALEAENRILNSMGFVSPMSNWAARQLVEEYGMDQGRILVTPPSAPIAPLGDRRREDSDGLVNIAFVGNDFERKGGPALLRLHQERFRNRARLHIVSRRFTEADRYVNVVGHGQIPYDVLIDELLPAMDVFCMPTNYDMSPWVCVHAGIAGLPTVVNGVGGVAELCVDGETGFLLPPGDTDALEKSLSRLIDDAALRERMGRCAHGYATKHLDAHENYNRLLDRIVEEC